MGGVSSRGTPAPGGKTSLTGERGSESEPLTVITGITALSGEGCTAATACTLLKTWKHIVRLQRNCYSKTYLLSRNIRPHRGSRDLALLSGNSLAVLPDTVEHSARGRLDTVTITSVDLGRHIAEVSENVRW